MEFVKLYCMSVFFFLFFFISFFFFFPFFFFFNDTATTEIYTLSLHDALPISEYAQRQIVWSSCPFTILMTIALCIDRIAGEGHVARLKKNAQGESQGACLVPPG